MSWLRRLFSRNRNKYEPSPHIVTVRRGKYQVQMYSDENIETAYAILDYLQKVDKPPKSYVTTHGPWANNTAKCKTCGYDLVEIHAGKLICQTLTIGLGPGWSTVDVSTGRSEDLKS